MNKVYNNFDSIVNSFRNFFSNFWLLFTVVFEKYDKCQYL